MQKKNPPRETLRKEVVSLGFCRQPEFGFIGKAKQSDYHIRFSMQF